MVGRGAEERTGYRSGDRSAPTPESSHEQREGLDRGSPESARCDICGAIMMGRHCKLVCVRCGYQRDCSDP